jgi:hypothetical protein
MQRRNCRRTRRGNALVEYSIGLGAIASAAFVAFNALGFGTSVIVGDLSNAFTLPCCFGFGNHVCPQKWSNNNPLQSCY